VAITRVFVMDRKELDDPEAQKTMLAQHHAGIEVRIIFREELPSSSTMGGGDIDSSYDFALYDDQVVTEVFQQSGTYFGRKTCQAGNVDKFLRFYELIEHSSNAITVEDERVILASGVPTLAA